MRDAAELLGLLLAGVVPLLAYLSAGSWLLRGLGSETRGTERLALAWLLVVYAPPQALRRCCGRYERAASPARCPDSTLRSLSHSPLVPLAGRNKRKR